MAVDETTGLDFPIYQRDLTALFGEPGPETEAAYIRVMDFGEFKDAFSHVVDYEGNPWSCRNY